MTLSQYTHPVRTHANFPWNLDGPGRQAEATARENMTIRLNGAALVF
jgi:hypothetical protein